METGTPDEDNSVLLPEKQVPDRQISDRQISDRQMSDRQISDKQISNKAIFDRHISERQICDRQISERQIYDRQMSDRKLPERQTSDMLYTDAPNRQVYERSAMDVRDKEDSIYHHWDYRRPPPFVHANTDSASQYLTFKTPDPVLGFNSGATLRQLSTDSYTDATTARCDPITSRGDTMTSRGNTSRAKPRDKKCNRKNDGLLKSRLFSPWDQPGVSIPKKRDPVEDMSNESSSDVGGGTSAPASVETLAEFTSGITASFIRFIFEEGSPIPRRLIWFVMWLACCTYALSNMKEAFSQYFTFETSSQLSFTHQTGGNLALPAITICNMNKFRKSWLADPENDMLRKYEEERVWGDLDIDINITEADENRAKSITVDQLELAGMHRIDTMILSAVFDETNLNVLEDWKPHFRMQSTELGICFTFNWDGSKKVKRTGADYGASFVIDINQSEYAPTQESAGIKVMLHHHEEPPLIKEYGLAIPPGSEAYISTRALELHNLGTPYLNSNCTSRPLNATEYYSQVACTLECHAEIIHSACNCKQSHMPQDNMEVCSLFDHRYCTEPEIQNIHKGVHDEKIKNCWCVEACSSTSYSYSLSKAEYPSIAAAQNILEHTDLKDIDSIKDNFILLHVFFETLAVEIVQKVPAYTTTNLLGDVGGNLGLFIGANVATLAEILDYVARLVYAWIRS